MKLLKDKYKLLEKIDEDEKVMLFLAQTVKDPVVNVDIRTLKQRRLKNPDFVQRYTQEFQTMAALDSPLFLRVIDIDFHQDVFFVASEHVEGKSIQAIIMEKEPLSLAQVINIITQLTRAFGHALRENVKHRSLTYSDIIYQPNGKIKILQFHIPRDVISNKDFEGKISTVGTDIFFIGCLFYELLTYKQLFGADGLSVRNVRTAKDFRLEAKNVAPPQLEAVKNIIFRCVTGDISARYQSIDELLDSLVKFVSDQINKTDVLTTMQVDPSKFMKTGQEAEPAGDGRQGGKAKAAPSFGDFKVPAFAGAGDAPQAPKMPLQPRPAGKDTVPAAQAGDEAAYDILFGKKSVRELKAVSYEAGPSVAREMGPENGTEIQNAQTRELALAEESGPPAKKHPRAGQSGEMWNNKKTAGAKSLLAKIANIWYSMLFVIAGFLSFLLYVFW